MVRTLIISLAVAVIIACGWSFGEAAPGGSPENPAGVINPAQNDPGQKLKGIPASGESQKGGDTVFVVYTVKGSREDHYVPSGWMGDYGDVTMNDQYTGDCHSKDGCVEFKYNARRSEGAGWAGVYWQNPANNWGSEKGGYNLVGMKKLTFWARGAKGGEQISKFLVGGISGKYSDSTKVEMGPVTLTKDWKQYTINLSGQDLSYISGGFAWTAQAFANPEGCTFYVDDIQYEGSPVAP